MNTIFSLQISAAVILDLVFGDPRWFPHPVRIMGLLCTRLETVSRSIVSSPAVAGTLTTAAVLTATAAVTFSVLFAASLLSPFLAQGVAVCLVYLSIAAKDLAVHSKNVYRALEEGSMGKAREAVGYIVGRDTADLDRAGIIRACVETVAENMVDGVTAPLFYAVLFSFFAAVTGGDPIIFAAIGAMCYKSVNTMDSMFGYRNEQYLLFGRSAALLDDVVNFIPARISSIFLIIAAFILFLDWKNAYTVFVKDRLNHASPNAGHPEAAVAGALGVQLGGVSMYFGKAVLKPTIGCSRREIAAKDILQTNTLMLTASFVFLVFMLMVREGILHYFL